MKTQAPRLSTLAEQIKALFPKATVTLGNTEVSTDAVYNKLRVPGKGRSGKLLVVEMDGHTVFSHNSAETYRTNAEVVEWMMVSQVRAALGMELCKYGWPFQSGMTKSEEKAFQAKMEQMFPEA